MSVQPSYRASGDSPQVIAEIAKQLFVNGEMTGRIFEAVDILSLQAGLKATLLLRWGEIRLQFEGDGDGECRSITSEAQPTALLLNRVAALWQVVSALQKKELDWESASIEVKKAAELPAAATGLFAAGCGFGAVALGVVNGVQHIEGLIAIFLSASLAGLLRRGVAAKSSNPYAQQFVAALVAGLIGGLAVQMHFSSAMLLVAFVPCMILVPGPHLLKGTLDLLEAHVSLGLARFTYGLVIMLAISVGVVLGLTLLGSPVPLTPAGVHVPLYADALGAAVAVAAFGIFYSTPLRMLPFAVVIGGIAHAARWLAMNLEGASVWSGAFIACVIVGLVMPTYCRKHSIPFAAIGFACVVSMVPGVFFFRTIAGMVEIASATNLHSDLVFQAVKDASITFTTLIAMTTGLIGSYWLTNLVTGRRA